MNNVDFRKINGELIIMDKSKAHRLNAELNAIKATDEFKKLSDALLPWANALDWRNLASDGKFYKLKQFCKANVIEWRMDPFGNDYVNFHFTHLPTNRHLGYSASNSWLETVTGRIRAQNEIISFLVAKLGLLEEKEESYMKSVTVNERHLANGTYIDYMVNFKYINTEIKNVIFSGPCTIVQWTDGDKTMVRCESEDFDKEKGLAMAIAKKFLGTNKSKSNYYDIFKKWIPEEEKKEEEETYDTDYTVKELAALLNVSESTILKDLKKGKFLGARKENGKWIIPFPG